MGKCKNTAKVLGGGVGGHLPTPSSFGGDPEDTAQDLMQEVSSQMGTSPKAPFRFTKSIRLLSILSLSPEGQLPQTIKCIIASMSE